MLPVRFQSDFEATLRESHSRDVAATVMDLAHDAIDNVLRKPIPAFLARVDLTADGMSAQMTPLFTPEGVVIRLDLGVSDFSFSIGIEKQRVHLTSVLYHEFYHLRDRLDPDFQLDHHEDSTGDRGKHRLLINAVWDVSIERRKLDTFGIAPFAWFSRTGLLHRDAVLANLHDLFGKEQVVEEIFIELWDTRKGLTTYPELVTFAARLPPMRQRPSRKHYLKRGFPWAALSKRGHGFVVQASAIQYDVTGEPCVFLVTCDESKNLHDEIKAGRGYLFPVRVTVVGEYEPGVILIRSDKLSDGAPVFAPGEAKRLPPDYEEQ